LAWRPLFTRAPTTLRDSCNTDAFAATADSPIWLAMKAGIGRRCRMRVIAREHPNAHALHPALAVTLVLVSTDGVQ
jgi:hypothetical protein